MRPNRVTQHVIACCLFGTFAYYVTSKTFQQHHEKREQIQRGIRQEREREAIYLEREKESEK